MASVLKMTVYAVFNKLCVAVYANGAEMTPGAVLRLGACTVTMLAHGNNTATGSSEVVIIETPKMRLTVWAPLAASISNDPAEDQVSTGAAGCLSH